MEYVEGVFWYEVVVLGELKELTDVDRPGVLFVAFLNIAVDIYIGDEPPCLNIFVGKGTRSNGG